MKWWLGALLLLGIGLGLRLGLLVYAMYVFLGVLWFSHARARRWIESVETGRAMDVTTVEIGDTAPVTVTLRNVSRGRIPWLLVEEALPQDATTGHAPRLRATGPRVAVLALRGGETRTLSYRVEFLRRGYYPIGPVLLETGDLFGLYRRYRLATEPSWVLVRPKVVALEGYDLASRRPIGEVRIRHRLFEDPTRANGVRPYERGDPLNRIHWRATARTGSLQSKLHEPSCVAGATVLLDFHRNSLRPARMPDGASPLDPRLRPMTGGVPRIEPVELDDFATELAVTTAASLARAVDMLGQPIGFMSNGGDAADRIREESRRRTFRTRSVAWAMTDRGTANDRLRPVVVETRRGAKQFFRILDTLARLEPTDGLEFADFVREVVPRLPRDATVVAVLTRVPEETALALGTLRRRGFAVTAVLVGGAITRYHDWASPPDWASRLLTEGISFRCVEDEAGLTRLCAEHFVH